MRSSHFDENNDLRTVYESLTGMARQEIQARLESRGYVDFKREVAEVSIEALGPLQTRYHQLTADPTNIDCLPAEGAAKVRPVADRTVGLVKQRVGL